jgi:hypothetical protein
MPQRSLAAGLEGPEAEAQMRREGAERHQLGRAVALLQIMALGGELLEDGLAQMLVLGEELPEADQAVARSGSRGASRSSACSWRWLRASGEDGKSAEDSGA